MPSAADPHSSWAETFAPKLSASVVSSMKSKFLSSYPSEILTPNTLPSLRLLSQVHHQLQKKEVKWIPWKYRLSQSRAEEVSSGRGAKLPRLEGLSLHNLIYDEPPSIEINNQSMGINAVRSMFDVFNVAVALAEGAHLAHLKAYSLKFLSFLTQRYDQDTGLRTPNIMEAQAADKHIWFIIGELVMDKGWSLDQALHEMTYIRSDMAMLLQARPRMLRPQPSRLINMVLIGSPPFHDQWREEGEIQRKRQEWRQVADRGDSGWPQETTLYEISKWVMHISGLQISSRMCIPQSRWHSVRTSTPSDATRINTTLTFNLSSAFGSDCHLG